MPDLPTYCLYLGLAADPTVICSGPGAAHRCYAQQPAGEPEEPYQSEFCLVSRHGACPYFQEATSRRVPPPTSLSEWQPAKRRRVPMWLVALAWAGVILLATMVALVYLRDTGVTLPSLPMAAQAVASPALLPKAEPAQPSAPAAVTGTTSLLVGRDPLCLQFTHARSGR
jgi:hypothetical protein